VWGRGWTRQVLARQTWAQAAERLPQYSVLVRLPSAQATIPPLYNMDPDDAKLNILAMLRWELRGIVRRGIKELELLQRLEGEAPNKVRHC
jgi:hypothetical protein